MFGHSDNLAKDVFRGAIAGMIGGVVGSWVMNSQIVERANRNAAARERVPEASRNPQTEKAESAKISEDATVKVAQAVSRKVLDRDLSATEKKIAGPAVHFGYGMLVGGLYGAVAELWPNIKTGFGMGYGIALWAIGDEAAVPALRLSPPPTQIPVEVHADTLSAHVCYGLTLDIVRRIAKILV